MEKQIRRIKLQNTIILSVLMVIIAAAFICFGVYRYQHVFTVEKWNKDVENRTKIVGDLLEKHQLIGMNESDVTDLLGEENSEQSSFKISRETFPPDTTLVYYLGVDYVDSEWLILSLEDGIVCDYCFDVS